jgi:hypothetical protein
MTEPVPEKPCSTCKISKPLTEYYVNKTKADGRQTVCIACKSLYNASYHRKTRQKYNPARYERRDQQIAENRQRLWSYLREHPCVDCGETDIVVLHFDHRGDGDKVSDVSRMISRGWRWEAIEAEIAKCDVVCANDHLRRTAWAQGWAKAGVIAA